MAEQSYTVYEPDWIKTDLLKRADELIFVKEGFSFWATVFSVLWMVYHRLWLPLAGFVMALVLMRMLAYLFGVAPDMIGILFVGLSLAFGFLANDIRRMNLEYENYKLVGAVHGTSQQECETRFFNSWKPLHKQEQKEGTI